MKTINNLLLTCSLGLLSAATAGAVPIQFYSSGAFLSSNGGVISTTAPSVGDAYTGNTLTFTTNLDSISIRYEDLATAASPSSINAPTSVGYGFFNLDASSLTSNGVVTIGAFSFDLTIHDLTDAGVTVIHGTSLGGTIAQNSALVSINWSPNIGVVGTTTFEVDTPVRLVPPNTTLGETTIQGEVTSSATPEPASMLLIGTGLLAFGYSSRRKLTA
jgi:hypothetical protein